MIDAYFTWPDRGLRYECRGCGACCKGLGIGIDVAGGQLAQLVGKRPELAVFVRKRGAATTAFNPRDRCWFLADDGLCRVEVEDGRSAKPASCRLFPFNRVFRAGELLVVDYNSVICPLRIADGDGVPHAEVLAEIESIQDPAIVGTPLGDGAKEATIIAREREIAERVFAAARTADAAEAWRAQGGAAGDAEPELAAPAGFAEVTGSAWRLPSRETLAAALVLTPSLRFNELYGPRPYAPRAKADPLLAQMWRAWLGVAALGETLAQRALGVQELTTLWSEQAPLAHAIARWADAPVLKPGPIELPPEPRVTALAQRFVDNRKPRRPLGELAAAALGSADAVTRVSAWKLADAILRAAF